MKTNVPRGIRIFYGIANNIRSNIALELINNDTRSYKDFVKLHKKESLKYICKLLNISCIGTKEELVKHIIALQRAKLKKGGDYEQIENESLHWRLKNLNPWSAWVKEEKNLLYVRVLIQLRDKLKNIITQYTDPTNPPDYNLDNPFMKEVLYKIVSKNQILNIKQKSRISNSSIDSINSLTNNTSSNSAFFTAPFNSLSLSSSYQNVSMLKTPYLAKRKRRSSLILRTGTTSDTSNVDITIHNIKNINDAKQSIKNVLINNFPILSELGENIEDFYTNLSQVFDINLYFNSFVLTFTDDYGFEQYIMKPVLTESFIMIQHMYALYNLVSSIKQIEKENTPYVSLTTSDLNYLFNELLFKVKTHPKENHKTYTDILKTNDFVESILNLKNKNLTYTHAIEQLDNSIDTLMKSNDFELCNQIINAMSNASIYKDDAYHSQGGWIHILLEMQTDAKFVSIAEDVRPNYNLSINHYIDSIFDNLGILTECCLTAATKDVKLGKNMNNTEMYKNKYFIKYAKRVDDAVSRINNQLLDRNYMISTINLKYPSSVTVIPLLRDYIIDVLTKITPLIKYSFID